MEHFSTEELAEIKGFPHHAKDRKDSPLDTQIGGSHYKHYKIQPIEFFIANDIPYAEAAIIKYVLRYKNKGKIEDLQKAKHLIDILEEFYA